MSKKQKPSLPHLITFQIGALYIHAVKQANILIRDNKFPIDMDHIPVLSQLYYSPNGSSQQKISLDLQRDKASINRTVSFLSRKKIVTVVRDEMDKRATIVQLTDQGRKLAMQAEALMKDMEESFILPLTDAEKNQLSILIAKLM